MNHARVFKKTSPNNKITVYVERRELMVEDGGIQPLCGILCVDPNYVKDRKVYGQFVLTFRYGREDEEVMGLRFSNEACLQAAQLWPVPEGEAEKETKLTQLQETLVKRLGAGAVPFNFSVSSLAPPSVTLLPARTYTGSPIGTNYDLRVFVGETPEDKPHKRSSIRMGIKLYQTAPFISRPQPPHAVSSKQFLLADGEVEVEATLDKDVYERGEPINVNVSVTNNSTKSVRKIKVLIAQFVDVAMFSNGNFKNVVASQESTDGCPVTPGCNIKKSFQLQPAKGTIKNWIALEEFYDRESCLAATVLKPNDKEKNVFAIYVSYYVKVKVLTGAIGGEVSVKVPFMYMKKPKPVPDTSGPPATFSITQDQTPLAPLEQQQHPITTSRSLLDLTSNGDTRRTNVRARRIPPSRSTSEDSGRCSEASSIFMDEERFKASLQVHKTNAKRLVGSTC
ncbi:phosrestin-2-like isoform X2 [Oratosquilla oratoria]|uniref:phosrestin-2-like isoform X2 n=1 Tax=Oratosquilla oratoria TaxID=337810 RepID=UPI003F7744C6